MLSIAQAQIKAVTETGEEVLLYDNYTWGYVHDFEIVEVLDIPLNSKAFNIPKSSTFLLKSERIPVGLHLDDQKWNVAKNPENKSAEFEFELKSGELFGLLITENVGMTIESLKKAAIINGRAVAPDLKVVKEEFRMVNGVKMLLMQLDGTSQGVKFSYYGYYYTSDKGTIQLITYTAQAALPDLLPLCEDFLNGLVLLE
jgi:hypothetical protein